MTERMNLSMEELGMVNGGTINETCLLDFYLFAYGYGNFGKKGPDGYLDVDQYRSFFASKGYTVFLSNDGSPNSYTKDGRSIGNEEMLKLIMNHEL